MWTEYSKGCELCQLGAKMVLFVTGVCHGTCFYCPLSARRKGKDVAYANERLVQCDADVIEEACQMDALGTGITGGEPLLKLARVIHYVKLLKSEFGAEHHVHLYSALAPSERTLAVLARVGLDEIRLHPPIDEWEHFSSSPHHVALKRAKALSLNVGIEIPAIKLVPAIVEALQELGGFLNLNELEFSETNYSAMVARGFVPRESDYAARGSCEIAEQIVAGAPLAHFCSSASKDSVQLRERLKRKARRLALPFQEVTEDGTLVYGILESGRSLSSLANLSSDQFAVVNGTLLTSWRLALELVANQPELAEKARIVETYPDGMVVEVTPLNDRLKPKTSIPGPNYNRLGCDRAGRQAR
jgi:uncharacterized protein